MTAPIALYVHWPFCASKCPYCDFNSHVRDGIDQQVWRDALLADLAHEAELTPGRTLSSIFFGGGTPSRMPPATVAALIDAAARHWPLAPDIEITLEANPNSVEVANFAALAVAGVNRVSIGVQSFDADVLNFLGRAHSSDEAVRAIATAQAHFARVNFDLIYARPGQTVPAWEGELARAIAFGTGHLSLYQLTIEPGTRFETLHRRGELPLPDEDTAADLYAATAAMTSSAGIAAYEISNHGRAGEQSRHNLTYWRYGDYLGVGPGAHGRRLAHATQRHRKPENYLAAVSQTGNGISLDAPLTPEARATEALLMGLRLAEGVSLAHIAANSGVPQDRLIDPAAAARLVDLGFVTLSGDRLKVAPHAMILLDAILPQIVAVA